MHFGDLERVVVCRVSRHARQRLHQPTSVSKDQEIPEEMQRSSQSSMAVLAERGCSLDPMKELDEMQSDRATRSTSKE